MAEQDNDIILWQAFKNGDREAFRNIYFKYYPHLAQYAQRLTTDKEIIKDAIHDLFVKLWNQKEHLANVLVVKPYLLVSLRHTLLNAFDKNKRTKTSELDDKLSFEMVFSVESDYIKSETHSLKAQQIIDALNQLTPRQKEVIYLRFYEEMSYEQIAEMMGITVKGTYKLFARGLEALRSILHISDISLCAILSLGELYLLPAQLSIIKIV